MKQNYFVHNGNRYDSGTIVILSRFDIYSRRVCDTKAKFLYYDTETNEYFIEIYGKEYKYDATYFDNSFVRIYNPSVRCVNSSKQQEKTHTFADELNIDGLLIAWIWYVFIMAVGVIFYDRIGIWIFASIIFFNYRNKKLKEAGYK